MWNRIREDPIGQSSVVQRTLPDYNRRMAVEGCLPYSVVHHQRTAEDHKREDLIERLLDMVVEDSPVVHIR